MGYLLAFIRVAAVFVVYLGFAIMGGLLACGFLAEKRRDHLVAGFTRHWARLSCFIFNIRVQVVGELPATPGALIVANHIGTPDIFVLGSCFPGFYVSKAEISQWPLIRWLAKAGKTIFAERSKRHQVKEIIQIMRDRLQEGCSVMLFPEGRASNGEQVLDFIPSTFEAAVVTKSPVVPVTIIYHDSHRPSIACWYETPFLPHILKLLINSRLDVTVFVHEPLTQMTDRRALAESSCRTIREKHRQEEEKRK